MDAVGDDLGATCGNIINCSYKLFAQTKPDGVLVLGDTNSCLSVIGAKRLHIPIFHMEAGNRCKDECLPEETNRRIVDIISDVTWHTQSMPVATLPTVDCLRSVLMLQAHLWQKFSITTLLRLRQVMFISVLVWRRVNISSFPHTVRRTLIQRRTSYPFQRYQPHGREV